MGTTGRPKKPTNIAVLHGDRKDRINTSEPKPSALVVEPPSWLGEQAIEVWNHLAPDLKAKGVLTAWDCEAFAAWCDAVVRRRHASKRLQVEGEVIELPVFNKNGEQAGFRIGKNPWTLVLNEADAQVQKYAARFGLTPSDRAGLSIGEASRDADDDLLTG
ncbi:phage terminase small subunit P27 family [Amycolatopsis circi]|uniref:phage terminase small subunit P27 family n=1 Tax=Amycolatopsis circi TaxID=871959 RepID=UPI000E276BED|nr:phage terminase small subunit P27 family [Amycolatopsis circi]